MCVVNFYNRTQQWQRLMSPNLTYFTYHMTNPTVKAAKTMQLVKSELALNTCVLTLKIRTPNKFENIDAVNKVLLSIVALMEQVR